MKRVFEAGVNLVVFKPVDRQALMRLLRVTQGAVERERCRYARISTACKVVLEFNGQNSFGTTIDMSLTGMRVKMNRSFPVNSIALATLELVPDSPRLTFKCRVVRQIDDDCMGVEYEELGQEESEKLEQFLLPLILETATMKTTPLG
jgi:c-di-GMP-binding flagellar brake protein YcgR